MIIDTPDPMLAEESLRTGFFYFIEAIATLAAAPEAQCESYGDFNVAWEIKDDVAAGRLFAEWPQLTVHQRTEMLSLIAALDQVPEVVLRSALSRQANLEAMSNPAWTPLREQAEKLLVVLQALSKSNAVWLNRGA